ncbi:MAG: hypothetical protein VXY93_12080, partial [Pseudomonadota bacterium]|nr:hypothetical protein [Pseudomonadota bacterium]
VVSGIVTSNTLRLPDATSGSLGRLQIGNGLDLSLYHDGTNSHIINNTGYLTIQSQDGVNGIFIARNAEVNLYFGPSVRLQTSSSGVTINRDLDVDGHTNLDNVSIAGVTTTTEVINIDADNKKLQIGASQDIKLYHNSGNSFIENSTGYLLVNSSGGDTVIRSNNDVYLQPASGEHAVKATANGSVDLYYDQNNHTTAKLRTSATGVTIDGTAVAGGLDISGDIDVDGHTNLDNVSITGVTTISNSLTVTSTAPQIFLTDTNANSDYAIVVNTGQFRIRDETNGQNRFAVNSDGHSDFYGRLDANSGLQVTQNATFNHDIDVDGHTNLDNVSVAGVTTFAQKINLSDNFIRNCRGFNS